MPSDADLTITRLGRFGDGLVAETDAGRRAGLRAVAGALPGERVRVRADGRLSAVLTPSPERIPPPCAHAETCGGCVLQHASDRLVADWKRARVIDALAARGLEAPVADTVTSPARARRRVTLAAARIKTGVALGFHRARSPTVVDLAECVVARPEIAAALPALRRLARLATPRKRPIDLGVTCSAAGLDVALSGAKSLDLDLRAAAAAWAEETDIARLAWNGEILAARRPPTQRFGPANVVPPPGAFLQATADGETALAARAEAAIAEAGARRVADLFAGCGTFALRLAAHWDVLAVEADADMVAALDRGWREVGGALKRVRAVSRDLFRRPLSAVELAGIDAVLFDPPRAGAEAQARALASWRGAVIVGASCDPDSFARDAAILAEGGWRLVHVTPIDQFRWSPHIELLGVFRR